MTMYLGMTEEGYQNAIKRTPLNDADKLGIENASELSDESLGEAIRLNDQTAFNLMHSFEEAYLAWWKKVMSLASLTLRELIRLQNFLL